MPTIKQLSAIWETQFEFFGGFGQPKANYIGTAEGASEGNGLTSLKHVETPLVRQSEFLKFSGEEIGSLIINTETDDLKILIN